MCPKIGNHIGLGEVKNKKKCRAIASRIKKPKSRVVVAEHNIETRANICSLVEQLNCVAVPVVSVSEILEVVRSRRVDLVLLDLDLVWLGELDTMDTIKQLAPLVPVVIMSHVITSALARRLCDRGAHSFLVKPVRRDQLAVTLFRYLL
jgi:DNA-binding NtrC family response regulator